VIENDILRHFCELSRALMHFPAILHDFPINLALENPQGDAMSVIAFWFFLRC